TASLGKTEHTFRVRVPGESISVRELIRSRVYQEVEEFNTRQPEVFRLLVQPGDAERTTNGFRMREPRFIDPQDQFAQAIEAFDRNGFVVLVDDRQVERLDARIDLRADTLVTFLQLVPLVGG
ncbi:MAG TPA: hypothetical protein VKP68_09510, partial [Ramlibacter sp.]|nr:hypothetical protein [Ramlibacter sp.]